MGVKGISKLIKEYYQSKEINLDYLRDKTIAIDTSIFLYKNKYATLKNNIRFLHESQEFNLQKKITIDFLKLFHYQIRNFRKYNITPFYIFDGIPPIEKGSIKQSRKDTNDKRISEDKITINITDIDTNNLKKLFTLLNIKYHTAFSEAEKYCAYLNKENIVDYVLTNDYDALTFNCQKLINYSGHKYNLFELPSILKELHISHSEYIDLCIVCGTDYYVKGIHGIGPKKGLQYVKTFGKIENWPDCNDKINFDLNNIRNLFTDFSNEKEHYNNSNKIN